MRYLFLLFSVFCFSQNGVQNPNRAFETATGGGAMATGGRSDLSTTQLIIVDTKDVYAPLVQVRPRVWKGGIKEAVTNNLGTPRYVVFNESGNYDVGLTPGPDFSSRTYGEGIFSDVRGGVDNMTILGQTAPLGGVTLINGYLKLERSSNIILRYFRARPKLLTGSPVTDDGKSTGIALPGNYVMIDHCSSSFGGDKGIIAADWHDDRPNYNVTIQKSISAESATLAFIVDGTNINQEWDRAGNVSFINNLFIGKRHRVPNIGGFNGYGEVLNNVVIWSGSRGMNVVYGNPNINVEGNYWAHYGTNAIHRFQEIGTVDPDVYVNGNYYNNPNLAFSLDGTNTQLEERSLWTYFNTSTQVPDSFFSDTRIDDSSITYPVTLLDPISAKEKVLNDVGHNKYIDDNGNIQTYIDDYDSTRIAEALLNQENTSHNHPDYVWPVIPSNSRPASYDTDNDGMADSWEVDEYGNLNQDFYQDFDEDGVPNLEEFTNRVDVEQAQTNYTKAVLAGASIMWLTFGENLTYNAERTAQWNSLSLSLDVYGEGDNGDTIDDMVTRLPAILSAHPDNTLFIIHIGGNNVSLTRPYSTATTQELQDISDDYDTLINLINNSGRKEDIIILPISFRSYADPQTSTTIYNDESLGSKPYNDNILLPKLRTNFPNLFDGNNNHKIDFYNWSRDNYQTYLGSDGVHPDADGEDIMSAFIATGIKNYIESGISIPPITLPTSLSIGQKTFESILIAN